MEGRGAVNFYSYRRHDTREMEGTVLVVASLDAPIEMNTVYKTRGEVTRVLDINMDISNPEDPKGVITLLGALNETGIKRNDKRKKYWTIRHIILTQFGWRRAKWSWFIVCRCLQGIPGPVE